MLSADTVSPNAAVGQGYNVYAYVANNPTRWVDPSGHTASGFAPPYDSGMFINATRQTTSMMYNSLQTFSLSTFGATMITMGARMETLIGLSGGLTAADMAMGLAVMASLMVMSFLIWSCLINQQSGWALRDLMGLTRTSPVQTGA